MQRQLDISEIKGANQVGLRQQNEKLVLTILRRQGPLPKAEIARRTGLSAQTTSVIMRALEQDGFLEKCEKVRGKIGQPSIPMRLASHGAYFFGPKVGRRSSEVVLVNFVGEIVAQRQRTHKYPTPETTIEFARKSIADIRDEMDQGARARIAGLGIAAPYFLWEWADSIGVDPAEMESWRTYDLEKELGQHYDFPTLLGNDASCACGAELVFGTSEMTSECLYLYFGYFIGGGVVINGKLFTGSFGNAGALGPLPVYGASGPARQLVDVASLAGLERRLVRLGLPAGVIWENADHWDIHADIIEDWLNDIIPATAYAVKSAISIIDFPRVIIDGSLPRSVLDKIVSCVSETLDTEVSSGLIIPDVHVGSLGRKARPLGAASLPLAQRYFVGI